MTAMPSGVRANESPPSVEISETSPSTIDPAANEAFKMARLRRNTTHRPSGEMRASLRWRVRWDICLGAASLPISRTYRFPTPETSEENHTLRWSLDICGRGDHAVASNKTSDLPSFTSKAET